MREKKLRTKVLHYFRFITYPLSEKDSVLYVNYWNDFGGRLTTDFRIHFCDRIVGLLDDELCRQVELNSVDASGYLFSWA
jgi:hypothetical protein